MGFIPIAHRRSHLQWSLAPQDLVVAFGLAVVRDQPVTPGMLLMTSSTFRAAIFRLKAAKLVVELDGKSQLVMPAFRPFVILASPHCFPAVVGPIVRGTKTAFSCTTSTATQADNFVWPDKQGSAVGRSILPLHKSVPMLSKDSPVLKVLRLHDLIRVSEGNERDLAKCEMAATLSP